jgi:hypothetical protein
MKHIEAASYEAVPKVPFFVNLCQIGRRIEYVKKQQA